MLLDFSPPPLLSPPLRFSLMLRAAFFAYERGGRHVDTLLMLISALASAGYAYATTQAPPPLLPPLRCLLLRALSLPCLRYAYGH